MSVNVSIVVRIRMYNVLTCVEGADSATFLCIAMKVCEDCDSSGDKCLCPPGQSQKWCVYHSYTICVPLIIP